jgi:hypothetical protein
VADFLPKRVKMADFLPKIVADFFMAEKKIKKNFQHAIIHGKGAYFEVNFYLCTRIET